MNFPAELKYSKSHEWIKLLDAAAYQALTEQQ